MGRQLKDIHNMYKLAEVAAELVEERTEYVTIRPVQ